MAFLDRVKINIPTTGNGQTLTMGSTFVGFRAFGDAGAVEGAIYPYVIEDGTAFELGSVVYSASAGTLTRTLRGSSTGNLLVLSGQAVLFVAALSGDLQDLSDRIDAIDDPVIAALVFGS
jgi:hypothetical protein